MKQIWRELPDDLKAKTLLVVIGIPSYLFIGILCGALNAAMWPDQFKGSETPMVIIVLGWPMFGWVGVVVWLAHWLGGTL